MAQLKTSRRALTRKRTRPTALEHILTHVSYVDTCLRQLLFLGRLFSLFSQSLFWLNVSYVMARWTHVSERERQTHTHTYTCVFVCVSVICVGSFENYDSERDRERKRETHIHFLICAGSFDSGLRKRDTHRMCSISGKQIKKKSYSLKMKKKIVDSFDSGFRH
jgi:hypothetical protein